MFQAGAKLESYQGYGEVMLMYKVPILALDWLIMENLGFDTAPSNCHLQLKTMIRTRSLNNRLSSYDEINENTRGLYLQFISAVDDLARRAVTEGDLITGNIGMEIYYLKDVSPHRVGTGVLIGVSGKVVLFAIGLETSSGSDLGEIRDIQSTITNDNFEIIFTTYGNFKLKCYIDKDRYNFKYSIK